MPLKIHKEMNENFDDIRSFRDEEISAKVAELSEIKQFMNLLATVFPLYPKNVLKERFAAIKTVAEFQREWDYPFLSSLEATKTHGVQLAGTERLSWHAPYLFISNHRDIILDAAFLNIKLIENQQDTTEIAIGDNLLIFDWIKDLVRINKSFIVHRSLNIRELLESSRHLSAYIRQNLTQRGQSVWLAQREGRAKNSDDRTQESVLKMLNMSGKGDFISNLKELNICPLAISYEYDPCDYLKARELQQRRDNPDFRKQPQNDLQSMVTGVMGYKGKVVYRLAGTIDCELAEIAARKLTKNEQITAIAQVIDNQIFKNYEIYEINKIAYDLLTKEKRFESDYSLTQKLDFERYMQLQINKTELTEKDNNFLRQKILEMYANPLINRLKAEKS
ncbi:MAG: 1-acyl-sn-glycerol-3-phosphate acyltransferase [Prevotellaceae bacterium]|nr:1-acyl-sn-glycerol-3-phosphate acyltransferase [Prevotellaceae bacterium]